MYNGPVSKSPPRADYTPFRLTGQGAQAGVGSPDVEGDFPAGYPYADSVSPWARDAMLRGVSRGWVRDPQGIVTHAEMDRLAALLSQRG